MSRRGCCPLAGEYHPVVVNRHTLNRLPRPYLYIGRPAVLGNPYSKKTYGLAALDMYREWLMHRAFVERAPEILAALNSITPAHHLVCYCKPAPCHGDIVLEVWEHLVGKGDFYEQ